MENGWILLAMKFFGRRPKGVLCCLEVSHGARKVSFGAGKVSLQGPPPPYPQNVDNLFFLTHPLVFFAFQGSPVASKNLGLFHNFMDSLQCKRA